MILSGEYYYSIAALFSCSAYLSGNILWLRILLVGASVVYIVAGISLGITSMIGWNLAYLAINVFHIMFLMLDKITINLPPETVEIYRRHFSTLSTREFKKLITVNNFKVFQGSEIVPENTVPDKLYIILTGQVAVNKSDLSITLLCVGDLIGEMSYMSKEPASASAIAVGEVQCAYWTHEDLDRLKLKNLDIYNQFISIVGRNLVRKLNRSNESCGKLTTKLDSLSLVG
jgi:hypothetical protein